jgi:hypothetical protein
MKKNAQISSNAKDRKLIKKPNISQQLKDQIKSNFSSNRNQCFQKPN